LIIGKLSEFIGILTTNLHNCSTTVSEVFLELIALEVFLKLIALNLMILLLFRSNLKNKIISKDQLALRIQLQQEDEDD
jgi:hypothetical protein